MFIYYLCTQLLTINLLFNKTDYKCLKKKLFKFELCSWTYISTYSVYRSFHFSEESKYPERKKVEKIKVN